VKKASAAERLTVHELDPELRDRLLALDEPVSRKDWADVTARSGGVRQRLARRTVASVVLAVVCFGAAATIAAAAAGFRVDHLIDFWDTPSAPQSAQSAFTEPLWMRGLPKGLELEKTRSIAVEAFRGERMRLFAAPIAHGGFCYEWALKPGTADVWIDEQGGCSFASQPLTLGYDDTRVSIVANPKLTDGVAITLTDGRVVKPRLRWVSAPVDAGFLLYQPPNGVHVAAIDALRDGDVVEHYPIEQAKLVLHLR
jgi:hypothetical protein